MSTVGKIEPQSCRSGLNQLFQDFRATSCRADGSNNLSSAEGISQLHEVTVKGSKERIVPLVMAANLDRKFSQ